VIINKYPTRRLYNTATHACVTLDDLADSIREGTELAVHEFKSRKDITRSVLLHIVLERESKANQNLLPISFLRQLIRFYGDSIQMLVPLFLEISMISFIREQEKLRQQAAPFGIAAVKALEEIARQNMEVFHQTVATIKASVSSNETRKSERSLA
jgi:polyhydroxyalkanoate synthesis repressor PhaR